MGFSSLLNADDLNVNKVGLDWKIKAKIKKTNAKTQFTAQRKWVIHEWTETGSGIILPVKTLLHHRRSRSEVSLVPANNWSHVQCPALKSVHHETGSNQFWGQVCTSRELCISLPAEAQNIHFRYLCVESLRRRKVLVLFSSSDVARCAKWRLIPCHWFCRWLCLSRWCSRSSLSKMADSHARLSSPQACWELPERSWRWWSSGRMETEPKKRRRCGRKTFVFFLFLIRRVISAFSLQSSGLLSYFLLGAHTQV